MIGPGSFCAKSPFLITSRRFTLICFGESGLPVLNAGHAFEQRPHSVQVYVSSICFHVMSPMVFVPNVMLSPSASSLIGVSRPFGVVRFSRMFGSERMTWKCFP